jgi:hypothetical protein
MKTFTIQAFAIALITTFLFSSCSKEDPLFPSIEQKLEGTWEYKDADFRKRWSLSWDDLMDDYKNITMQFEEGGKMTYSDEKTGKYYTGTWEVSKDCGNHVLTASLNEKETGEALFINWEELCVTKRKITACSSNSEGFFQYKLEKQ